MCRDHRGGLVRPAGPQRVVSRRASRRLGAGEGPVRPDRVFDERLQHERTALAWERTAVSGMAMGVILARYVAVELHPALAVVGVAQVVASALLLVWAARHYDDLHGPLRSGESPVHPGAARIVGFGTVVFTGAALILTAAVIVNSR
ncbi:MAG: DUF202 domain-containing protein [Ilumatobacter sp.]